MITFKLREDEFLEGSSLFALWPRKQVFAIILQVATFLIIGCSFAFSKFVSLDSIAVGLAFIFFALIIPVATAIGRPIAFRRKYHRSFKKLIEPLAPTSVSWDPSGLTFETSGKQIFSSWRDFVKWQQTTLLIVLHYKESKVVMLPKRAFSEPAELDHFIQLLASSVVGVRSSFWRNKR